MVQSQKYEEVPTEAQEGLLRSSSHSEIEPSQDLMAASQQSRSRQLMAPLLWVLGCLFLMVGAYMYARTRSRQFDSLVYSPAQEALRYQKERFPNAFNEATHFMGEPSPQLDNYWEETYNVPSRIPKWQADRLENPTIELLGDEGYYVVLLDIFHSTHCLNEICKSLHPEYYAPYHIRMNTTEEKAQLHLDHCVEHVRLALWCGAADISPISFHWKEDGHMEGKSGYTHTCRDPRAILNWARKNKIHQPLP